MILLHSKLTLSPSLYFLTFGLIASAILLNSCEARNGWISLGNPMSEVTRIVAVNGNEIWVESSNSMLFTARITFNCESGSTCWTWIAANELPNYATNPILPIKRDSNCTTMVPQSPAVNPTGSMIECIYSPIPVGSYIGQFYFALMSDGNIMFLDNSRSHAPFVMISGFSAFGIPFFVMLVAIAVIILYFSLRSRSKIRIFLPY